MVSVAFVGGAEPPPHPLASNQVAAQTTKARGAATWTRRLLAKPLRRTSQQASSERSSAIALNTAGILGVPGTFPNGRIITLEVFDTLTTKAAPVDPLTATDAGDSEHVEDIGAPVQVSVTVPLNPSFGVTCRL